MRKSFEDSVFSGFFVLFIIAFFVSIIFSCGNSDIAKEKRYEKQQVIQYQEKCEHNLIPVSKYKIITGQYKIIQKCTKCGKEIEGGFEL